MLTVFHSRKPPGLFRPISLQRRVLLAWEDNSGTDGQGGQRQIGDQQRTAGSPTSVPFAFLPPSHPPRGFSPCVLPNSTPSPRRCCSRLAPSLRRCCADYGADPVQLATADPRPRPHAKGVQTAGPTWEFNPEGGAPLSGWNPHVGPLVCLPPCSRTRPRLSVAAATLAVEGAP